jgi:hypothetical protein
MSSISGTFFSDKRIYDVLEKGDHVPICLNFGACLQVLNVFVCSLYSQPIFIAM